jgi:type II secretory pathway pseudopilin PulG
VIEVVVVVAILGVLSSLVLPAVMRARESARRTQCMNRLRQVGLALQAFESTHQRIPAIAAGPWPRNYSSLAQLLPHLDQDAAYNLLNFSVAPGTVPDPNERRRVESARVEVFLCPADPLAKGQNFGGTNYRFNAGTYPGLGCQPHEGDPPYPLGGDGFIHNVLELRPGSGIGNRLADVQDGLSHTVALAERLVGDGDSSVYYPAGDLFQAGEWETGSDCWTREQWIRRCASLTDPQPEHNSRMGHAWVNGDFIDAIYNHVETPNSPIPDCGLNTGGVVSARSGHRGGVNVVMGDAQSRFVSEEIDLGVWRSLGSRAGGEVLREGSY